MMTRRRVPTLTSVDRCAIALARQVSSRDQCRFDDMKKISCGEAHRARHASIAEGDFTSRLFFDGRKQYGDNVNDAIETNAAG
jgi:hypothetical protein